MKRQYIYSDREFAWNVTGTGVFCVVAGVYSVIMLLGGSHLFWIFLPICAYQLYNTFITISNPRVVTVTPETISFSAYGRTHTYKFDEINFCRIREIDMHKKLYLRLGDAQNQKGRYWIPVKFMENGRELWDILAYLEYQKEPEQLKFQTRKPPQNPLEPDSPPDQGEGVEAPGPDTPDKKP